MGSRSTLRICSSVAAAFQFQRHPADADNGTENSVHSTPGARENRYDSRPAGPWMTTSSSTYPAVVSDCFKL